MQNQIQSLNSSSDFSKNWFNQAVCAKEKKNPLSSGLGVSLSAHKKEKDDTESREPFYT